MRNAVIKLIESRISANYFDTSKRITDAEVEELVRLATLAPSAFNFQNWKFIAVHSTEAKMRLKSVSFGQQKVIDAAVTFIICGTLEAQKQLPQMLQPSVDAGILEESTFQQWVGMANRAHIGNPALQRDEAFRSASLAAMTLMLAAESMGFVTGAMSGFDPHGVAHEFGLAATEIPVILVAVGHPAPGNWPQKPRRPLHEVMEMV